jgi:hypothetical protein
VARVIDVLDDHLGLPVALCAVGVQEGGKFAPGNVLGRPHHPLVSFVGGAVNVPGGDTARQDALNCTSVKFCEGFSC